MSLISATEIYVVTARKLEIDLFDFTDHKIISIPSFTKPEENDQICGITLSSNSKLLAAVTAVSKRIVLYELPLTDNPKVFSLPRSASKIRFSVNNNYLFVADKTGDVLRYDINVDNDTGTKIMGYLSLLLDVLQSDDERFIITSDRDEKIRVSCYPNTYNIHSFCLGHKEFVNHIEFVPNNNKFLLSTSGDGTVKIWDYKTGRNCCTIDTNSEASETDLKTNFLKEMDAQALPIIHFDAVKLDEETSLLAVSIYSLDKLLIYSIKTNDDKSSFDYKLEYTIPLEIFPKSLKFLHTKLFIFDGFIIHIYNFIHKDGKVSLMLTKKEQVFDEHAINIHSEICDVQKEIDNIKILYKRKIDNVQEYQERKKQRIKAITSAT